MSDDNSNVEQEQNETAVVSSKDTEALLERMVEERLAKVKSSLDKAYSERDEALKRAVQLEDERKQQKLSALEAEGKHKEVAEMKLTELQEKLRIAEERNIKLTRDAAVRDALTGLDFRNERSQQMAYRDVVDQLIQDPETGGWIHKSGASIKEFVNAFSKDEDNTFLFKPKTNSGSGTSSVGGTPKLDPNKKMSDLSTAEIMQLAAAGKLGNFSL